MTSETFTPSPCQLILEVYTPPSLDDPTEVVDWEVSTDPSHPFPYLLAPRQYAAQEIDAIRCTASIGTIEIGVIDVPMTPGNQTTGFMTARVHDLRGRRCRLRRYINESIGFVVIADGPAGTPKLDASYSAYRWPIRDTRDTERKTLAFAAGGSASIVPRGALRGWGLYTDADGDHALLSPTLSNPITGVMNVSDFGGGSSLGIVNLAGHFSGVPLLVDDPRLVVDDDAIAAIQSTQIGSNAFAALNADVLWRKAGDTVWNVARPRGTVRFPQPAFGTAPARLTVDDPDPVLCLNYVTLFSDDDVAVDFPPDGTAMEIVVRYRGIATEAFPYYVEGQLGAVLANFYTGKYTVVDNSGITGAVYDPAGLDPLTASPLSAIRYDAGALSNMQEKVLLRQTETVNDGRAFTEAQLYAPSGWIPALDSDGQISPVQRGRPETIDSALTITNATVVPNTGWTAGEKTVSSVEYDYKRYFVPDADSGFEAAADGLASRDITIEYEDAASKLRYGDNPESYDASAFSAIGTGLGLNLPGVTETADLMSQYARFDVLDRFRAGAQSIALAVRRSLLPNVRVGSWIPWNLSWLPDRTSGHRGSVIAAAQIVAIRDDDCVWRTITLEESSAEGAVGGEPGYYDNGQVLTDGYDPGYYDNGIELSDEAES